MKAIILAAGQGSRLRPFTNDRPKCLLDLAGASLLAHNLRALRSAGVSDIAVVGGYRADRIPSDGIDLIINQRFADTNMVATLFCASRILTSGEDVIIAYGDCVYAPSVVSKVAACQAPIGLAVDVKWRRYWEMRMDDPLSDAETLKLDEEMCVVELGKKPKTYDDIEGQYMGLFRIGADYAVRLHDIYKSLDKSADYDGKDYDNMYMTTFVQYLIDIGWRVQAVPVENGWLEFDTPDDYNLYNRLLGENALKTLLPLGE